MASRVTLVLACAMLVFAAVADARSRPRPKAKNVYEFISGSRDLSYLKAIVDKAGYKGALMDPEFDGTFFAPTNKAVEEVLTFLGVPWEAFMKDDLQLLNIMKYHTLVYKYTSTYYHSDNIMTTRTQLGPEATLQWNNGTFSVYGISMLNVAHVIVKDVAFGRGVVHIVDAALIPPFKSAWEAAEMNFDTMSTLLRVIDVSKVTTSMKNASFAATVLAPTNSAWSKFAFSMNTTVPMLLRNAPLVKSLLAFHVLPGVTDIAELITPGFMASTWAGPNKQVEFSGSVDGYWHVKGVPDWNVANVILANIRAGSAIIHAIDTVLLPLPMPAPSP